MAVYCLSFNEYLLDAYICINIKYRHCPHIKSILLIDPMKENIYLFFSIRNETWQSLTMLCENDSRVCSLNLHSQHTEQKNMNFLSKGTLGTLCIIQYTIYTQKTTTIAIKHIHFFFYKG